MEILKIVLTVIFALICLALIVIILLQEGKAAGLSGSISGGAETFWGKNKGRSIEGKLEKATKFIVIGFLVLSVVLNML